MSPPERTVIDKPADRADWLAVRHPWFNASSAAVLFDRHPFQTAGDYATVKLTGEEGPPTRAMARGQRLEDVIALWWAEERRCTVIEPPALYTAGRMMATVDRVIVRTGDISKLPVGMPVEIKTTATRRAGPEPYWLDQCQAIMLCKDAPTLALVWFDSSLDIQWETIDADPELQADMLQRAERFMAAIDLGFAPDWVMLSADNLAHIYDKPADMVDLDGAGLDLVRELDALRQIRLDAEHDEKDVKDKLANILRGKEIAAYDGIPVLSWKAVNVGQRFDVTGFRQDHPELYNEYLIDAAPQRRFHLIMGTPA